MAVLPDLAAIFNRLSSSPSFIKEGCTPRRHPTLLVQLLNFLPLHSCVLLGQTGRNFYSHSELKVNGYRTAWLIRFWVNAWRFLVAGKHCVQCYFRVRSRNPHNGLCAVCNALSSDGLDSITALPTGGGRDLHEATIISTAVDSPMDLHHLSLVLQEIHQCPTAFPCLWLDRRFAWQFDKWCHYAAVQRARALGPGHHDGSRPFRNQNKIAPGSCMQLPGAPGVHLPGSSTRLLSSRVCSLGFMLAHPHRMWSRCGNQGPYFAWIPHHPFVRKPWQLRHSNYSHDIPCPDLYPVFTATAQGYLYTGDPLEAEDTYPCW